VYGVAMLYALHATFKSGVESPVALHSEFSAHLMQPVLRIHLAGPLFDSSGFRCGILIIMQAPDEESVRRFAENSPYNQAGLYGSISISRFEAEVGQI
jgi:uncharacterized protein YciI